MAPVNRILVVDDEEAVRHALSQVLSKHGYVSLPASSGEEAISAVKSSKVNLVLLDLMMRELDGMETLSRLKGIDPSMPVIMITGHGDIDTAVQATKLGAYDFITKPPDTKRLVETIQRALDLAELKKSVKQLETSLGWVFGRSAAMEPVIRQIRHNAWSDAPVTIQGEKGTGKPAAARVIHNLSKRAELPFQSIKAGRMSESLLDEELLGRDTGAAGDSVEIERGVFGRARGGTIFIDELSHLPLSLQTKLASVVEGENGKGAGARLILGTDTDFRRLASEDRVSEALHLCLSEPPIILPPLRERIEDIRFLAGKFLWKVSIELDTEVGDLGDDVLDVLMRHSWPGNIRELESVIRGSVRLSQGRALTPEVVRSAMRGGAEERLSGSPLSSRAPVPEGVDRPSSGQGLEPKEALFDENCWRDVVRLSPVGMFIHVNGRLVLANPAFAQMVGATGPEELSGSIAIDLVHADHRDEVTRRAWEVMNQKEKVPLPLMEHKFLRLDGSTVDVEVTAFPFRYEGHDAAMVVAQDITERKQAEDVAAARQRELEDKTASLEEANSALKVVLSHRDQDKEELEKRILTNVRKLVIPYLEKVRAGHLTESQMAYMDIIESNLNHIISPFLQKMAAEYSRFTPTEIQIAALIKEGKTTKEIAELLNMGTGTVHTHRNAVRAKLGLSNMDVNLRSFLLSLEQ